MFSALNNNWRLKMGSKQLEITSGAVFLLVLLMTIAPSTCTFAISSVNITDVTDVSATFSWQLDVTGDNATELHRLHVQLQHNLGYQVDEKCLNFSQEIVTFGGFLQPFTSYSACVRIVQLSSAASDCDDDSTTQITANKCMSFTTDFVVWSAGSLAAVACAAAILIILVVVLAINFLNPKKSINDEIDKAKMRDWSKKKRTESARDFMKSVASLRDASSFRSDASSFRE